MANETPHPEEPELLPVANEPPNSGQAVADNSNIKPPEPAASESVASTTPKVPEVQNLPNSPPQPFQFEGSAAEYFGIWLVNLLLSVVTLGSYSAWAKVRRLRFFLGHTTIGGHRFEYHANPLAILKGRLIAVGVLIVLNVISGFAPLLGGVTTLALLLLFPWVANRSLRFNARMTSFRNVRFDFQGSYGKGFVAFLIFPFLSILSLGLLAPFATRYSTRYLAASHRYGTSELEADPPLTALYRGLLIAFGIVVLPLLVLIGLLISKMTDLEMPTVWMVDEVPPDFVLPLQFLPMVLVLVFYIGYFCYRAIARNVVFGHLTLAKVHSFESRLSGTRLAWILLSNTLLIVLTLGLLQPWAAVRRWRYEKETLTLIPGGPLDEFIGQVQTSDEVISSEYADLQDMDLGL
ncbi:MAG: YjgN family protein [SAR324 cluster bacterium]|nr:YjgN family protein [SAR324 cluster bacterium]